LKEISKKKPSPNPWLLLVYLLLSPSDANSRIDDTPDGIGGWKKLERELLAQEQAEDDYENNNPNKQIRYVTYTKTKKNGDGTTTVYSGRSSGDASESALDIVKRRDAEHKAKNYMLNGYEDAVVDVQAVGSKRDPTAKWAIRGREQQLIDKNGRAQRDVDFFGNPGTSGNVIRGVSKYNRMGRIYHNQSNLKFGGQIWEFTGIR
jgi:hypothetical protein